MQCKPIVIMIILFSLLINSITVLAGSVNNTTEGSPQWNEYSAGDTLNAATLNNHFDDIANAINDNDSRINSHETRIDATELSVNGNSSRISVLESGQPQTNRIFIPIAGTENGSTINQNGVTVDLPHSIDTKVIGQTFGKPPGYSSGNTSLMVLIGGCSNTTIIYKGNSPKLSKLNIGPNPTTPACDDTDSCGKSSFDIQGGNTIYTISSDVGELQDMNTPIFTRLGSDPEDICNNVVQIFGFFLDYPVN